MIALSMLFESSFTTDGFLSMAGERSRVVGPVVAAGGILSHQYVNGWRKTHGYFHDRTSLCRWLEKNPGVFSWSHIDLSMVGEKTMDIFVIAHRFVDG